MKNFMTLNYIFIALLSVMLISCGNGKNNSNQSGLITNNSGGNVTGESGTIGESPDSSVNPIVITENILNPSAVSMNGSEITVNTENGYLSSGNENIQITENVNGVWVISSGVVITVKDNSGATVSGKISSDPSGNILFIPDSPLTAGEAYNLTISSGNSIFTVQVIIPVDNTSKSDSLFAGVNVNSDDTTASIKDIYLNDKSKAIFGWEFLQPSKPGTYPYSIQLTNVEKGAEVYLTFYGVYDIPGYENDIFYQRWYAGDGVLGNKVEDYKWNVNGGSTWAISFDETDYSIPNPAGGYYSFKKTYAEIRIMKDGVDITSESNAKIIGLKK